jgi:hypothetical protein
MVSCALRRSSRTAILFAAVAAMAGCQGKSKKKPPAQEGQAQPADTAQDDPNKGLPVAWPAKPAGRFESLPWLAGGLRVAATSKPSPTVAVARVGKVTLYDPQGKVLSDFDMPGTPQVLEFLDVDKDELPELVVGAGIGRETREAETRFAIADGKDWTEIKVIDLGRSQRHQVVDVAIDGQGFLWVANFVSKYMVALSTVDPMAGTAKRVLNRRMVGGIAFAKVGDSQRLVMARIYGEKRGEHGLVELKEDGGFGTLPSVRGARAIRSYGGALFIADGWHREYKAKGRGLITKLVPGPGAWERVVLANVDGVSGFDELDIGDIDGDGTAEVVATGDGPAIAVPVNATGAVAAQALGGVKAYDAAIADLDGQGGAEVVIVGLESGIWRPE